MPDGAELFYNTPYGMKAAPHPVFLAMALLLHAVMGAALYRGLGEKQSPSLPTPVAVSLITSQSASAEQPLSAPPAEKPPPPRPARKPPVAAKSKPSSRSAIQPSKVKSSETAAPARQPEAPAPQTAAPSVEPAVSSPAPSAPVKTDVGIPASYAATNRKPDYPSLSKRYGEEGTVVLRVLVKENGTAGEIELKTSSGFPLLDKAAMNEVRNWRFKPATLDGKPVAEWYQIPIPFKLER